MINHCTFIPAKEVSVDLSQRKIQPALVHSPTMDWMPDGECAFHTRKNCQGYP